MNPLDKWNQESERRWFWGKVRFVMMTTLNLIALGMCLWVIFK